MNRVTLIGNIGKIDEHKTQYGRLLAINLATEESKKLDDGKWEKITTWHRVIIKGKAAEQSFKVGDTVFCDGKNVVREYEKDGQKNRSYEVHCNFIKLFAKLEKQTKNDYSEDIPF